MRPNPTWIRSLRAPSTLLLALVVSSCGAVSGSIPPPRPPTATGHFQVGAAKADITPMPGYPMGGFAVGGRISRGVWMRLYARAFCKGVSGTIRSPRFTCRQARERLGFVGIVGD